MRAYSTASIFTKSRPLSQSKTSPCPGLFPTSFPSATLAYHQKLCRQPSVVTNQARSRPPEGISRLSLRAMPTAIKVEQRALKSESPLVDPLSLPSRPLSIKMQANVKEEPSSDSELSLPPSDIEDFGLGIKRESGVKQEPVGETPIGFGIGSRFFSRHVPTKTERKADDFKDATRIAGKKLEAYGEETRNDNNLERRRIMVNWKVKEEQDDGETGLTEIDNGIEKEGLSTEERIRLRRFAYGEGSANGSGNGNQTVSSITRTESANKRKRKEPVRIHTPRIKREVKLEKEGGTIPLFKDENTLSESSIGEGPSTRPQKRSRAKALSTTALPPPNWQEMYNLVKSMRSAGGIASNAPVDTMGCERLALPPNSTTRVTPEISRFQSLVALMLSSQTKDTVTAVAMKNLQTKLPHPGLCIESILSVSDSKLNELIKLVGFHNRKTTYLKQTALILKNQYNSDIPDTVEGLTSLPGVGPKMAYLTLSVAWNKTIGIGVDVHVHRITNLWGWNGNKGAKSPEEAREMLQCWLPKEYWREINWLLVGFGQVVCLPRAPRCGECLLAERGLCRAAKTLSGRSQTQVKVKSEEVKVEYEDESNGEGKRKVKMEIKEEDRVVKEETIEYDALDPAVKVEDEEQQGIAEVIDPNKAEIKQEETLTDMEDGILYHLKHEIQPEVEPTPEPEANLPARKRRTARSTVVAEGSIGSGRITRSAGKRAKR